MRIFFFLFLMGCVTTTGEDSFVRIEIDTAGGEIDADGDGYGWNDCDDANSSVHPGSEDICNGVDDDCDGVLDEAGSDWFYDADGDGYGVDQEVVNKCTRPAGYASLRGDCDDTSARYHPYASEEDCTDPNDYNCDGFVAYRDDDGDGYPACQDCSDFSSALNPDAQEHCDGVDENCNGIVDENPVDGTEWYEDADGDGYGDAVSSMVVCESPEGYVLNFDDCNDGDEKINPAEPEHCLDGVDSNCNGDGDDATSIDASHFFRDIDGDGYGNPAYGTLDTCFLEMVAEEIWSEQGNDCDEGNIAIHPDAVEVCDGIDNDCSGVADEGAC